MMPRSSFYVDHLSICFCLLCHRRAKLYANDLIFKVVGITVCLVDGFVLYSKTTET